MQGPEFEEEEEEEESYVEQTPYPPRGGMDVEAVAEEDEGTRISDGEEEDEQDTEEYEEEDDDVVYLVRFKIFLQEMEFVLLKRESRRSAK